MQLRVIAAAVFGCAVSANATLRATARQEPAGAGQVETSKQLACDECNKHAEYLPDCVCHASDVMGTFENDATKKLTTASEYGSTTEQTGVERLPEGWTWHCRPVSGTGVWEQC
eukprot:TRINITY_DN474_c0_g1_i1.p2 TRINITY_DN474_c0_g1~~TRINITY_DN474_c0_g1_i1.p2  ORF type:complete len:114 (+),score=37.39 TRINITY_DN474_c0_g1_i1:91-432(+)